MARQFFDPTAMIPPEWQARTERARVFNPALLCIGGQWVLAYRVVFTPDDHRIAICRLDSSLHVQPATVLALSDAIIDAGTLLQDPRLIAQQGRLWLYYDHYRPGQPNRMVLVKDALQTVCTQSLAADHFEVLVVDNGSTDATPQVVADFCRRYANVRYLVEPRLGLAHARNCGWRAAQGAYVAYLDDDCQAPWAWCSHAHALIAARLPVAMIGPFYALHGTPPPRWWRPEFDRFHAGEYAPQAGNLPEKASVGGVSLFIRQDILQQTGGFDPTLGMKGELLGDEEDSDLGRRIPRVTGQTIYYDPALWVYHLVRAEKLNLRFLIRDQFARGRYYYRALYDQKQPEGWSRFLLQSGKVSVKLAYLIGQALLRARKPTPYIEQYLYGHAEFRRLIWQLGQLYEGLWIGLKGLGSQTHPASK